MDVVSILRKKKQELTGLEITVRGQKADKYPKKYTDIGIEFLVKGTFNALPPILLGISRAIPLSYAVDAFRSTLMGFPEGYPELAPIDVEILIVTLFGILMPLVGYWLYNAAERGARRSGSLSEY